LKIVVKSVANFGNQKNNNCFDGYAAHTSAAFLFHIILNFFQENNSLEMNEQQELPKDSCNTENLPIEEPLDITNKLAEDNNNNDQIQPKQVSLKRRSSIQNRINFLNNVSLRTLDKIIFQLNRKIPEFDWKAFAATMQDILGEDWIPEIYEEVKMSDNHSDTLFKCWSTKDSYTIENLIKILERMGHQTLLNLLRSK